MVTSLTKWDRLPLGLLFFAVLLAVTVTYMTSQELLAVLPATDPRQVLAGVESAVLLVCFALSCAVSLQIWSPYISQWDVILATALTLALPSTSLGMVQDPTAVWLICAKLLGLSSVRMVYLAFNRPRLPLRIVWASSALGAVVALGLTVLALFVPQTVLPTRISLLHAGGICMIIIAALVFATSSRTYSFALAGALLGAGVFCLALPGVDTLDWRTGMGWFDPQQKPFVIFSVVCLLIALPCFGAFFGLIWTLEVLKSDDYKGFASVLLFCAALLIVLGKLPFLTLGIAVLCAWLYLFMAFVYDLFTVGIRNLSASSRDEKSSRNRVFQLAVWPFHICFAVSGIMATMASGIWVFSNGSPGAHLSLGFGILALLLFSSLSVVFSAQTFFLCRDGRALRHFWTLSLVGLLLYTSGVGTGVIAPRMISQIVPKTQIAESIDVLSECGDVHVWIDDLEINLRFEKQAALLGAFHSETKSIVRMGLVADGPTLGTIDYRTPFWQAKSAILSVRPDELAPLCQRWFGPHHGR